MGCSSSKSSHAHGPAQNNKEVVQSILPRETNTEDNVMPFSDEAVKVNPHVATSEDDMMPATDETDHSALICGGIWLPGIVPPENVMVESTMEKPRSPTAHASEATTRCSTAGTAPGSFEFQVVSVPETEIKGAFHMYKLGIHPRFWHTLGCSWEKLEHEMKESKSAGIILQLFWILPAHTHTREPAHGLVVIKVHQSPSSKTGELVHLSIAGKDWESKLPSVIDVMRREMFKNLPIKAISVTLWYSEKADTGQFAIDDTIESVFKKKGFRWCQLRHEEDGQHGQIMALRRNGRYGDADPPMPEEVPFHKEDPIFMARVSASD